MKNHIITLSLFICLLGSLGSFGTLTSAYAARTECSSYNQNVYYLLDGYNGGAAPYPGMLMSTEKIEIGNLLSRERKTYNQAPSTGDWRVQLEFTELSDLSTGQSNPHMVVRDYAAELKVLDEQGKFLSKHFVICHFVQIMAP
jgi:hypothetical protein